MAKDRLIRSHNDVIIVVFILSKTVQKLKDLQLVENRWLF